MTNSNDSCHVDITGVLVAGGKSRRMGGDKACIELSGEHLYRRPLNLLQQLFTKVIIAGDRPDLETGVIPAIPDIYPGSALGGLFTGLKTAKTDWIFVIPCDLPYPDRGIAEQLILSRNGADAVVPRTPDGYEPLFALYHRRCLPHMENMLKSNRYRILDLYQEIQVVFLDLQPLSFDWQRAFLNINTPAQLNALKDH